MTRPRAFALAALAAGLAAGCPAPPQKTIEVEVERDGKAVLRGSFPAPVDVTPVDAWYRLEGKRLAAAGPIAPDPNDPGAAVLTGEVRVTLTHDGKRVAGAILDRLRVDRVLGATDVWEIPRAELERATKPALRPGFDQKKAP
ncbi:MAG: hypothetical protein C0501_09790 [Isosphaera sp.]|nr:hypothetical protein [Isosphaera sp.]